MSDRDAREVETPEYRIEEIVFDAGESILPPAAAGAGSGWRLAYVGPSVRPGRVLLTWERVRAWRGAPPPDLTWPLRNRMAGLAAAGPAAREAEPALGTEAPRPRGGAWEDLARTIFRHALGASLQLGGHPLGAVGEAEVAAREEALLNEIAARQPELTRGGRA